MRSFPSVWIRRLQFPVLNGRRDVENKCHGVVCAFVHDRVYVVAELVVLRGFVDIAGDR